MGIMVGPNIVRDGLQMWLDASSSKCYPGSGTTLYDVTRNTTGISLVGSTISGGHFYFGGQGETDGSPTGDYISVPTSVTEVQSNSNGLTYELWINPNVNERRSLLFGSGTINHIELYAGTSGGYFRTEGAVQNGYSFGSASPTGGIPINTWGQLNIAWAPNGATREVKWYWNGVLFHTHSNFYSGTSGGSENFYFSGIGRATGSGAYLYAKSWSGNINGIKIYNRTLNSDEVIQNFDAQYKRFNL